MTKGLLLSFLAAGLAAASPLHTEEGRFVDADGRHVLLNAVNIGFSHHVEAAPGEANWAWNHGGKEDFARIKSWGFNSVRLVLFWGCIEPAPGEYSEAFLDAVEERVNWAHGHGLFVVLDMHQDLWGAGVPGGRGAPAWAMLAKDEPHVSEGPVWSAAYFQSPRVQAAFDAFWENRPGPDGAGLQDRFAGAWRHVAKRFSAHPAVVGYDLFNEPFPGSPVSQVMRAMTAAMIPELDRRGVPVAELTPLEAGMAALEAAKSSPELYGRWLQAGGAMARALDRKRLAPMYARVARAIREVDTRSILFFAPAITANFGVATGLPPIPGADGEPDPRQAFAPHIYEDDPERMGMAADPLFEHAAKLGLPVFFGEWGNLTNRDGIFDADPVPAARMLVDLFDKHLANRAYWYYAPNLDTLDLFNEVLARPCPLATAGRIEEYRFDSDTQELFCAWASAGGPEINSVLFLPQWRYPNGYSARTSPPSLRFHARPPVEGLPNWYLVVPGTESQQRRTLQLSPSPR